MTREEAIKILKDWDGYFIGHSSDDVNEALDMAIKALEQPEQHWIPCGERLPERSVNVLADIDYCEVIEILSLETDGQGMLYWEDASGDYEFLNDVKAWMPLPAPYQLQKGDAE